MKTKLFSLTTIAFFSCIQLFAQVPKKPLVAKPAMKAPVAQKISSHVGNGDLVKLQNAVVNIVVGDDGKDKGSKLSIAINVTAKDQDHECGRYSGSDAYLPGENVTIPINLLAGIPYISGAGLPAGEQKLALREAVFSDFTSGGGDIGLLFESTNDIWKIKSLTVSLFFDNDPVTPYKITWTNIQLSHDAPALYLQFDKNFKPIQSPIKNIYKRKTNL